MSNTKNNLNNSHVGAGRDVHIGDKNTNEQSDYRLLIFGVILVVVVGFVVLLIYYKPIPNQSASHLENTSLENKPKNKTPDINIVNPETLSPDKKEKRNLKKVKTPAIDHASITKKTSKKSSSEKNTITETKKKPNQKLYTSGYVKTNDDSAKPLSRIKVIGGGSSTTTDENGYFQLPIKELPSTNILTITYSGPGIYTDRSYPEVYKKNRNIFLKPNN